MRTYKDFILFLKDNFEVRPLKDHANPKNSRVCLLRHDIDKDFGEAYNMAEIEQSIGVQSTYFMLNTADYYMKNKFMQKCLIIQDMGHEIGIHNNYLADSLPYKRVLNGISDAISLDIKTFVHYGVDIVGTSAHGVQALFGKTGVTNFDIFKECKAAWKENKIEIDNIPLHMLSLKQFGFEYEASFLPNQDYYLSDSGNKWKCSKAPMEYHPDFATAPIIPKVDHADVIDYLDKLCKEDKPNFTIQILTHEWWWKKENDLHT